MSFIVPINSEDEMLAFGASFSRAVNFSSCIIYLRGVLGAGKTTLVRGFLRALQYEGVVKSPTYTFIEPYFFPAKTVYHLDLYRLRDARELDFLGIEDFESNSILLIEWPEQGVGHLVEADIVCYLEVISENERRLTCEARTLKGKDIIDKIRLNLWKQ